VKYSKHITIVLFSFVFIACATVQPTGTKINSQVTPKATFAQKVVPENTVALPQPTPTPVETSTLAPTPTPKVTPITFRGKVSRGQIFEEVILDGLIFRLDPLKQGWEIWIGDKSETGHNFSGVATPPFHGINARYIEGWHFRNSDNSGPNEAGEKNVNAPQYERNFCFFLNETDYQIAYYRLNDQLLSSEEEGQEIREKYSLIKSRAGILRINDLKLGNLIVNEQAWIEYMEFEVELSLTDECRML